jgi:hypothetical protein
MINQAEKLVKQTNYILIIKNNYNNQIINYNSKNRN